uniref:SLED domain-containing protein n=1 Tax=Takifugu rubripes TaxID=31033 RepID=A0A674NWK0_TAKRU
PVPVLVPVPAPVPVPVLVPVPAPAPVLVPFWVLCPLVCVYLNKFGKVGPHLDQQRIQQLPDHFGPGGASSVLQQCVQAFVDSAYHQATAFGCLRSGQGGGIISAYFDQQQHTLTLPTVSSVTYALRFLEKLCHSLQCDPLFCSQPVARGGVHSESRAHTPGECS